MADLQASDFRQFFFELHKRNPFPWQAALADRVCTGDWPEVIDLPTASGKTACIDIALFALALRGPEVPRRIFFVVDRRVVVNEAFLRMKGICEKLREAKEGVLGSVAEQLRKSAGNDEPLSVYEMRGGAFRDESWVKNPLQPTVVASTVDQVGSRLLFRGYGVSDYSWPLHAGLIGNDALIILDEAHCSLAFAQTLQRIEQYRDVSWTEDPIRTPFRFVEMTATPARPRGERFRITDADRAGETLKKRLHASKPTRLIDVKGKKDDFGKLAEKLISQALELASAAEGKRIAILVNRVRTAKTVHQRLRDKAKDAAVELVIGRMRAVDRDDLYRDKLQNLKSDAKRKADDPITFVVSTQCLEVGADLDFDVLVSECASIDALQQRFGRLDRLGEFERARGAIVIGSWQVNPKQPDPVYGYALSKTWEWLKSIARENPEVDMGIEATDGPRPTAAELLPANSNEMRLRGEDAPILLPAHVDVLAQTSPVPDPDPFIEMFLHGPDRGVPDVQVVWRADLDNVAPEDKVWEDIVRLCPPSSRETMPVQISTFRRWFAGETDADDRESDLPLGTDEEEPKQRVPRHALVWQGDESYLITQASKVRPGQTIILPVSAKGWDDLGHIPKDAMKDLGDRAAFEVRNSVTLRLHPEVMKEWPETPGRQALMEYAGQDGKDLDKMREPLNVYRAELEASTKAWPYDFLEAFFTKPDQLRRKELNEYPDQSGYVLQGRRAKRSQAAKERIFLEDHLADVEKAVGEMTAALRADLRPSLRLAAKFHDYGKADVRFQAWLLGGDLMAARYLPKPIAKSGNYRVGKQESVGLPNGFRHELLSLLFAEKSDEIKDDTRDLILHLIASHHGRCRPFAPVILDKDAECVPFGGISVCKRERLENAPHRLDRGVPDRFWKLTRKYGWWGLAYLEALLRLADWKASKGENAEVSE
ncbi:MAG: type I-U CRISPR-associated helicase/endonuclease Cas3 [Bryobacteraceae bacterium]